MSSPQPVVDTFADDLLEEIAGLGDDRPYEEIGVPTFFIGEDVSYGAAPPVPRLDERASTLGWNFARMAHALAAKVPELTTADIGKLMEVFADRHFPSFGARLPVKRVIADAALMTELDHPMPEPADAVLVELAAGMAGARAIRAVNFHATPSYHADEYRRQLAAYAELFEPVTRDTFAAAVAGDWPHERPGLIVLLFEGFRDNYDVMLPILEEFGFTGVFFVPSIFPGIPADLQREYAATHDLDPALADEYEGERIALSWDELRDIRRRGHIVGCHTRNHVELTADTPVSILREETLLAKAELEDELGEEVELFCWSIGAGLGVHPEADRLVRKAGFRYLFSNFKIQKLQ
jgi:peptidoglycan/xylan/chitin deacetylase (PgdA/CDA1 family)